MDLDPASNAKVLCFTRFYLMTLPICPNTPWRIWRTIPLAAMSK
jgi:hypothetical protein